MINRNFASAFAVLLLTAGLFTTPASAGEKCTEADLDALTGQMLDTLVEHPKSGDHLEEEIQRVADEGYGGQPSDEESCEALEKVIEALKAY